MQNTPISRPNRVERAQQRLESAITKLEGAVKQRAGTDKDMVPAAEATDLRHENDRLKQLNADASHRLESAIGRLGRALAGTTGVAAE